MPQGTVPLLVTEYIPIQFPVNTTALDTLRHDVALQSQGEAVELFDTMSVLVTAVSCATIYDSADEAILHLNTGQRVLLFDHQPNKKLRPEGIDETLWTEILKIKNKSTAITDVSGPQSEVTIDLALIWNHIKKDTDIIGQTKFFIQSFFSSLTPGITIHLQGEIPTLPLFFAIYLARPYGYTIMFEDTEGTRVTLFSNL